VSEGEKAKPRRRRGRRRANRAAASSPQIGDPGGVAKPPTADPDAPVGPDTPAGAPRRRQGSRLRTVHEISAGGLVIDGIDRPRAEQSAALIGRTDRRGRMIWSLPKGHIEQGETAEQTAIREVAE